MSDDKRISEETRKIFVDETQVGGENEQNTRGIELSKCLYRTLKTVIIHSIENDAAVRLITFLVSTINLNIKEDGPIAIQQSDKKIFINKRALQAPMSSYLTLRDLAALLDSKKLGGITFAKEVNFNQIKAFLILFATTVDRPEFSYYDSLEKQLKEAKLDHIMINRPLGIAGSGEEDISIDRGQLAHFLYAKALIFMKKYVVNFDDAGLRSIFANKCVRTIQDLVDICSNRSQYILGLVSLKYFEEHFYHHSVNVAILSILLGQKLGLEKSQLAELGMCGLFHDIGLMNKAQQNPDREGSEDHTLRGVGLFLREKNLTFSLLRRIVVIFEHHFEYSKRNVPEQYQKFEHDLFAKIIHVVDTFDILTSDDGVHQPELPDRALAKMMQLSGVKFDPGLLKAFVNTVGIFPVGSVVVLNTGEVGVVYHSNLNPSKFNKPQVKLVKRTNGAPLDGQIINLDGQTQRYIEKTVDPKTFGINATHYIMS